MIKNHETMCTSIPYFRYWVTWVTGKDSSMGCVECIDLSASASHAPGQEGKGWGTEGASGGG